MDSNAIDAAAGSSAATMDDHQCPTAACDWTVAPTVDSDAATSASADCAYATDCTTTYDRAGAAHDRASAAYD